MEKDTCTTDYVSPIGRLTIASDGTSITGIWLEGQKYFAATLDAASRERDVPALAAAREWLDIYFAGREPDFTPPLAPRGSGFRQTVWEILRGIPYGSLTTYGEIARRLEGSSGGRVSARAVGGAVGHNPISIIIPCHRVVGAGGNLTGYAGGINAKIWLLRHEGVRMDGLFVPKKGTAL